MILGLKYSEILLLHRKSSVILKVFQKYCIVPQTNICKLFETLSNCRKLSQTQVLMLVSFLRPAYIGSTSHLTDISNEKGS